MDARLSFPLSACVEFLALHSLINNLIDDYVTPETLHYSSVTKPEAGGITSCYQWAGSGLKPCGFHLSPYRHSCVKWTPRVKKTCDSMLVLPGLGTPLILPNKELLNREEEGKTGTTSLMTC